jgi:hypothetical protein
MGFEDGHIARCSLVAALGDNEVVNTLHYDMHDSTVDDSPTLQGLADRLADDLLGPWGALFPAAWTIQPVTVMDEKDPLAPLATRDGAVSGAPAAGTGGTPTSTNKAPLEECVVATLRTAHIGRRFRGRMFLPPIFDEEATDNGILASGHASLYNTFLAAIPREPDLVTGAGDGNAIWSVYSRTQRAANLDPYATRIDTVQLQTKLRWLRSRGA